MTTTDGIKIMGKDKRYMIGVCKTTDVSNGEDILPPYYKVYSVEVWDNQPPTTWYEAEFDTLEEAMAYTRAQSKEKEQYK